MKEIKLLDEGIVFDIQSFCIHDGPGIRTLVFLKGCPLRCPWCCNPESQQFGTDLLFQPEKCIGCGSCARICPQSAIKVLDGRLNFHRELCRNCGECAKLCYAEARIIKGRRMNTDEILKEVLKDSLFYSRSGGGVTLGGGEPLAQPDFAASILKRLKSQGLHTAMETSGYAQWRDIEKVLDYVDLFLYDVKHLDPHVHREVTGVDNQLILANLRRLTQYGGRVILRTPVIPGFNDSTEQLLAIGRYSLEVGIQEMHLLPYHRFGAGKYRLLSRDYPFQGVRELAKEKIEAFKRCLASEGLDVKTGG